MKDVFDVPGCGNDGNEGGLDVVEGDELEDRGVAVVEDELGLGVVCNDFNLFIALS